jgi:hypothetical protein
MKLTLRQGGGRRRGQLKSQPQKCIGFQAARTPGTDLGLLCVTWPPSEYGPWTRRCLASATSVWGLTSSPWLRGDAVGKPSLLMSGQGRIWDALALQGCLWDQGEAGASPGISPGLVHLIPSSPCSPLHQSLPWILESLGSKPSAQVCFWDNLTKHTAEMSFGVKTEADVPVCMDICNCMSWADVSGHLCKGPMDTIVLIASLSHCWGAKSSCPRVLGWQKHGIQHWTDEIHRTMAQGRRVPHAMQQLHSGSEWTWRRQVLW